MTLASWYPRLPSAERRTTPFRACFAEEGEKPVTGTVYLPPANKHLEIRGGLLHLDKGPPVSGQRPSGTVLFRSMAADVGNHGIGVVLTGMGDDGAEGLLAMRRAGAYTLAEDRSTAVVYGMPHAAEQMGAVRLLLPLSALAPRIHDLINDSSPGGRP